ncbi:MAG: PEP-utilizing enzyme, partial [Candidatus Saganbacteria bacterium]|nr:PEP-utilizing enzyme [Candidatus Saganbacteria bacterium]
LIQLKEKDGIRDIVLITDYIIPKELFRIQDLIVGLVIRGATKTSHAAIYSRAIEMPGVVGTHRDLIKEKREEKIKIDLSDLIIISGEEGRVILSPAKETLDLYTEKFKRNIQKRAELIRELGGLPNLTIDKKSFEVLVNVDREEELSGTMRYGEFPIGIFRTEYLFPNSKLPTIEEQVRIYSKVAEIAKGACATIRTQDLGADKEIAGIETMKEPNPALGWRALRRVISQDPDFVALQEDQIKAILAASGKYANIRMMFPMIKDVEDFLFAKDLVNKVMESLKKDKIKFNEKIQMGAMIEIPSACLGVGPIAQHADFLSVGTNDLIQYTLAVDRLNPKVRMMFGGFHPAVLWLIKNVVDGSQGKPVCICGENAGEPLEALLMFVLGVQGFSMIPFFIPRVKRIFTAINYGELRSAFEKENILGLPTAESVKDAFWNILPKEIREKISAI